MENENVEVEFDDTRSPEAQAIIDAENGVEAPMTEEEEADVSLPSDEFEDEGTEQELFAGKYNSQEELVKGIKNIGSNLPEYVLDGMSAEALETHYKELNKEFSSGSNRKHTDGSEAEKEDSIEDDVKPEVVSQELWSDIEAQYIENGNITAEQYDALNKQGIPDSVIDGYIDGVQSKQDNFTKSVYDLAGGESEYNTIKSWAEENLSDKELATVSGMKDYDQILFAMEGIKARYTASQGSQSNIIRGNRTTSSSGGYGSESQYMADVADSRYGTDVNFRNKVKAKLAKSNLTD